ncbi:MAG: imidazole glycerol phosphate synthase subunit HisH [Alphaproteobacteria bacterium]
MRIVIVDYGAGNLRSVAKSCEKVAPQHEIIVTARAEDLKTADKIILPGVGAFGDCVAGLTALPGMRDALEEEVRQKGKPFLGICVGMQLLADFGFEHGKHAGMGWIAGDVIDLEPTDKTLKVPHMGWNNLNIKSSHPVLEGIQTGDDVYFVHSYHYRPQNTGDILATTEYGEELVALIGRDNILGVQFHPEKSQQVGLRFIQNFIEWTI